jgi:excisionase family DNA binding protein
MTHIRAKQTEVLTLAEAARFLRLKAAKVRALAAAGKIPGAELGGEWRFLKSALEDQLRARRDSAEVFLSQAGVLQGDDTMPELLYEIYQQRGRPMVEDED